MKGVDLDRKEEEFKEQCDSGDVRGCHSLGEWYMLIKHDDAAAQALFRRNCDPPPEAKHRRYAPSCFSVASYLMSGSKDNVGAAAHFEKACAAGSVEACANLGAIYRRGLPEVAADTAKAEVFFEQGCSGGDAKSCFQLAVPRQQAGNGPGALHYYEKACLLGYPWGCSNAYVMLSRGDGVPVDLERAKRMRTVGEELATAMGLKSM